MTQHLIKTADLIQRHMLVGIFRINGWGCSFQNYLLNLACVSENMEMGDAIRIMEFLKEEESNLISEDDRLVNLVTIIHSKYSLTITITQKLDTISNSGYFDYIIQDADDNILKVSQSYYGGAPPNQITKNDAEYLLTAFIEEKSKV